jgi:hypothetical protein
LFVPHDVPSVTLPLSVQTDVPVEHDVVPVLHGLVGWQLAFAVHAPQLPLLQTMFVPQEVPLVTLPVSPQTGAPVSHAIAPVRHGLPLTVQLAPVWQEMQLPLALQTLFVPQLVPAATAVPLSLHTGVPEEQTSAPWWQGFEGTHEAPSWQEVHCPLEQTIPLPHEVPFGCWPLSVQTGVPVVQPIVPLLQGFPLTEQLAPTVHAEQLPLLQTRFWPQVVPFA